MHLHNVGRLPKGEREVGTGIEEKRSQRTCRSCCHCHNLLLRLFIVASVDLIAIGRWTAVAPAEFRSACSRLTKMSACPNRMNSIVRYSVFPQGAFPRWSCSNRSWCFVRAQFCSRARSTRLSAAYWSGHEVFRHSGLGVWTVVCLGLAVQKGVGAISVQE